MVDTAPSTHLFLSEDEARKHWLEERHHSIGSSDAAAVLGLHPYKSAYALWAEKSGLVQPESYPREAAQWGQILEPIIAAQYEKRTGRALTDHGRFCLRRNAQYPFAHATLDREIVAFDTRGAGVLEIKNVSLRLASHWGEDGSAPPYYHVQLQHQLMTTGHRWGCFAALLGGNELLISPDIERNDRFIALLAEKEAQFMDRVRNGVPPPPDGSQSAANTLQALYPEENGQTIELPASAVEWDRELQQIKEQLKELTSRRDRIENVLKQTLKEASAGTLPGGCVIYTYKNIFKKGYVVEGHSFRQLRRQLTNSGTSSPAKLRKRRHRLPSN